MTVPALEVELAYRACEEITRREAANFHYGIRLLPRPKRRALSAVYALARRIDDIGESFLTLEIAPDVKIKLQKTAISMVLPKGTLKSA